MSIIKNIYARQIFVSRVNRNPTIEIELDVVTTKVVRGSSSTGKYEGMVGTSIFKQNLIDQYLIQKDDTPNKNKLVSNALLAIAKAASILPLPVPMIKRGVFLLFL